MASRRSTEPKSPPESHGYLAWSRDWAVGIFAILPLWMGYELLRLTLAPHERNGAEAMVRESLLLLGPHSLVLVRIAFGVTVLCAALSILRRKVPWARVALVSALEGAVYGLMLGPVTGVLTLYALEGGAILASSLTSDLIGSLGAGIFEEAVFRLGMLSCIALLVARATRGLGVPDVAVVAIAVIASAVLFSLFHHFGAGAEPYRSDVFLFRAIAGGLLGVMFVTRGFSVCVYAHAVYDVHYYLTR